MHQTSNVEAQGTASNSKSFDTVFWAATFVSCSANTYGKLSQDEHCRHNSLGLIYAAPEARTLRFPQLLLQCCALKPKAVVCAILPILATLAAMLCSKAHGCCVQYCQFSPLLLHCFALRNMTANPLCCPNLACLVACMTCKIASCLI